MQTAQFIEALQSDLRELAQLGGDELVQAAHRLEGAVKQSATLRLIDALTQVALEVSSQLPNGHLDVRLAGQDPELVYVEEEGEEPQAQSAEDGLTARITLRLPESLKVARRDGRGGRGCLGQHVARPGARSARCRAAAAAGRSSRDKRITGYAQS